MWKDFDNLFQLRPDYNDGSPQAVKLTLSRVAASQPGQSNRIEETMGEGSYEVKWTGEKGNIWSYTITGPDGAGLAAYAPNGMPWTYTVTEQLSGGWEKIYTPKPGTSSAEATDETQDNAILQLQPDLENSLEASVPFSKVWKDKDGNTIEDDYLGADLSVTFQVQVRERDGDRTWKDPRIYFTGALGERYNQMFPKPEEAFTKTLTDSINGTWKGTFEKLPEAIIKGDPSTVLLNTDGDTAPDTSILTFLEYRVVETKVEIAYTDSTPIQISVPVDNTDHTDPYEQYTNSSGSILTDVTFQSDGNVTTNILDLQSITIQKIWEDNNNQWNTRPNPTGDYTWETSFVVQKKNGNNWENVQVYTDEIAQDLVVTLRGGNEDTEGGWTAAITGLPAGEYRIRELQPGWNEDDQITDEDMVEDGGFYYGNAYEAIYNKSGNHFTVTNRLETIPDTDNSSITAVKECRKIPPLP